MKKLYSLLTMAAVFGLLLATPGSLHAAFPSIGNDTLGPDVMITFNGTTLTTAYNVHGQGPYDGIEDTYVGVTNNSSTTLLGFSLAGSNIFGFDGDGQSAYTHVSYDASGYAGPGTSFTITNNNLGFVNFLNGGLAPGQTAWFTLEETLSTSNPITAGGGGGGGITTVPDAGSSFALLSSSVFALGMLRRRFGK